MLCYSKLTYAGRSVIYSSQENRSQWKIENDRNNSNHNDIANSIMGDGNNENDYTIEGSNDNNENDYTIEGNGENMPSLENYTIEGSNDNDGNESKENESNNNNNNDNNDNNTENDNDADINMDGSDNNENDSDSDSGYVNPFTEKKSWKAVLFFVDRAVKYQQAHQDTYPRLYKDSNNNQHIIFKKRFWVAVDIIQRSYHFYKLRVDYVFSLTNYWPLIKEALIKYDNNHFWVADDDSDCPNITRMNEACRSLCDYLYQRIDTDISDNEIDEELKELPQPIRRSARVAQNVKDGKGIPPPLPPKLESWHHIIRVCQMAKAKIEETMDPDNNENSQVMENIRAINNAYKSWSKRCYDHIYIVQLMQPVIAAMNRRKYLTDTGSFRLLGQRGIKDF